MAITNDPRFYKIYAVLSINENSPNKLLDALYKCNRSFTRKHSKQLKSTTLKRIRNKNIANHCYIARVSIYLYLNNIKSFFRIAKLTISFK